MPEVQDSWSGLVPEWQRYRRDPDSYNADSKRRSDAASVGRSLPFMYDEPSAWALLNMVHYGTPWELGEMDAKDMYNPATASYTVERHGDVLVALVSDEHVTVQVENGGQKVGEPYELRPGVPTPVLQSQYPLPMISIQNYLVKLLVSAPPERAALKFVWGYADTKQRRLLAEQLHAYGPPGRGGIVCGYCAAQDGREAHEQLPDWHNAKRLPIGIIPDLSLPDE